MTTAVKTPKSVTVDVTGVVERADLIERAPFSRNRYMPGVETELVLDVCLRLPDGSAVYFKTVAARKVVASVPGAAVVTHTLDAEPAKWMKEVNKDRSVATPGVPNDNKVVSLVNVGDTVRVTGRVKADKVSRLGKSYRLLNWVRRQSV